MNTVRQKQCTVRVAITATTATIYPPGTLNINIHTAPPREEAVRLMAEPQMGHNVMDSPESQYLQLQSRISRSNEKKFICNYLPDCKAAFSRQEHLQRHIRKHTGERPFSCGCGRTFTRLDNLRQHAQTVHSGTEMAQISDEQNAIAAATKMRPTPNSPPPRVNGSSDTDPYPRPVMKLPRTASRPSTRDPSLERLTPPATIISTPPSIQPEAAMPNPYETMTFMPTTLDTHVDSSTYHPPTHNYPAFRNALASYTPNTYHSSMQHSDVESSVGSQPISSLVKRRAPKHDFVYTGGHMMHSPGTINSNGTDFDFSRHTADTTPDEGEQMSEYINNGLEPKGSDQSDKDRIGSEGLEAMTLLSELAAARRD